MNLILPIFISKRFFSGIAAGIFGLIFVFLGGWWFTFSVGLIVHLALLEYFRMAKFAGMRPAIKTTLVACQILLFLTQLGAQGGLAQELSIAVLPLSGAAICGWLLLQPITGSIADIASSIFGLFYLGYLPSHWIRLRNLNDLDLISGLKLLSIHDNINLSSGMIITVFACLLIVSSDIGSYVLGRKFGKHSLSQISPKKTIEGAIGGVGCASLLGAFVGELFGWQYGFLVGGLLGGLVAVFALVGDLTESMMKRNAGLKDSGDAIPGHGGILDRIDSYLFTPAVIYYSFTLIVPLINN